MSLAQLMTNAMIRTIRQIVWIQSKYRRQRDAGARESESCLSILSYGQRQRIPPPWRNDSERPLTRAAARRGRTHVAQIARATVYVRHVYVCVCVYHARTYAYIISRALAHMRVATACVYPSAKGRRTGRDGRDRLDTVRSASLSPKEAGEN